MGLTTFLKAFVDRKDSAAWATIGSLALQFLCAKVPVVCDILQSVSTGIFGMPAESTLGGLLVYGLMRATSKGLKAPAAPPAAPPA